MNYADVGKAGRMLRKYGFDEDLEPWIKKLRHLINNAGKRDIKCTLMLSEYIRLAGRAGLTSPHQIGKTRDQYGMARIGDRGNYEWGNCRFLLSVDNIAEKATNGGNAAMAKKQTGKYADSHEPTRLGALKRSKAFILFSPDGKKHTGINVRQFARDNDLNQGALIGVCSGIRPHHKGWTGRYK